MMSSLWASPQCPTGTGNRSQPTAVGDFNGDGLSDRKACARVLEPGAFRAVFLRWVRPEPLRSSPLLTDGTPPDCHGDGFPRGPTTSFDLCLYGCSHQA